MNRHHSKNSRSLGDQQQLVDGNALPERYSNSFQEDRYDFVWHLRWDSFVLPSKYWPWSLQLGPLVSTIWWDFSLLKNERSFLNIWNTESCTGGSEPRSLQQSLRQAWFDLVTFRNTSVCTLVWTEAIDDVQRGLSRSTVRSDSRM